MKPLAELTLLALVLTLIFLGRPDKRDIELPGVECVIDGITVNLPERLCEMSDGTW